MTRWPHCAAARPEISLGQARSADQRLIHRCNARDALALNVDTVGHRCDLFKIFVSELEVDGGGVLPYAVGLGGDQDE